MRNTLVASLFFVLALLPACDDDDDDFGDEIEDARDLGVERGNALADEANLDLANASDPIALAVSGGILLAIDEGEILQAEAALSGIVMDPETIAYAQRMIDEHTAHRSATLALLDRFDIEPVDSRVSNTLRAEAMAELDRLIDDVTYLELQITMHQQSFVLVGALLQSSPRIEWTQFLEDTQAIIDAHRIDAEVILRSLGQ